jgi:hypothetical protein
MQSEKLINSINLEPSIKEENLINTGTISSRNKPRAPVITFDKENSVSIKEESNSDGDKENLEPIELVLCDANKEIIKNSVKVSFKLHISILT